MWNHQIDCPPRGGVKWSGVLLPYTRGMLFMTLNGLIETNRCYTTFNSTPFNFNISVIPKPDEDRMWLTVVGFTSWGGRGYLNSPLDGAGPKLYGSRFSMVKPSWSTLGEGDRFSGVGHTEGPRGYWLGSEVFPAPVLTDAALPMLVFTDDSLPILQTKWSDHNSVDLIYYGLTITQYRPTEFYLNEGNVSLHLCTDISYNSGMWTDILLYLIVSNLFFEWYVVHKYDMNIDAQVYMVPPSPITITLSLYMWQNCGHKI